MKYFLEHISWNHHPLEIHVYVNMKQAFNSLKPHEITGGHSFVISQSSDLWQVDEVTLKLELTSE